MPRILFVDTGAWVAVADRSDQYHDRAAAFYRQALSQYQRLLTTGLVLAETYALLRRGLTTELALRWLDAVLASSSVEVVFEDRALVTRARELLARYRDQDFSLTDAVSFAVMRQRRLREAFSFDKHFEVAGFTCLPREPQ